MNQQVYIKKGRRYHPVGPRDGFTGFPSDGIWLVQQKVGALSSECVLKLGELEHMGPAVNLIIGYQDRINRFLMEASDREEIFINNMTINDFTKKMLKEITKK